MNFRKSKLLYPFSECTFLCFVNLTFEYFSLKLVTLPYFRTLHLGIWFRTQGTVSKNYCVGVVDVAVERLKENSSTRGWYRLFRPTAGQSVESD